MENYEIVKFVDNDFELDVKTDLLKETVWLTQKQMSYLFSVNVDTISFHIKNILKENELDESVSEYSSVTASDGKKYKMKVYNLDMIISVGYRVKSKRGIVFRRWANQILKSYLINGFSINEKRCLECSSNIVSLNNRLTQLEKDNGLIKKEIFIDNINLIEKGNVPKAIYSLNKIFNLSKYKIVVIDNYIDLDTIRYLEKYNKKIEIITGNSKLKEYAFNEYINIIVDGSFHSRYILIDDLFSYVLTHSLNSIGKNNFEIINLDVTPKMILNKK